MADIVEDARYGRIDDLRRKLDDGADINFVNAQGDTALLWAAWDGKTDIVRLLIERGADRTLRNRNGSLTALELAMKAGHAEIVQLLSEPVKPPAPAERWEKMGAATIAHIGNYPNLDMKITTVFNFASRERFIISENVKARTQAIGTPVGFDALQQETVTEALDEFTKQGGKADRDFVLGGVASLDKRKLKLQA